MGRTAFLLIQLWLAGAGSLPAVGAQTPDFSGAWRMDPARSESAHQAVPIGKVVLLIRQSPSEVAMETRSSENGTRQVRAETLVFRLDGTEATTEGADKSAVKTRGHWDGEKLVTETERSINGSSITTHYVHSLSPDHKVLKVEKTLTVQHGYQFANSKSYGNGTDVYVRTAGE